LGALDFHKEHLKIPRGKGEKKMQAEEARKKEVSLPTKVVECFVKEFLA